MATSTSTRVMMNDVVNDVLVYDYNDVEFASYMRDVQLYNKELEEYNSTYGEGSDISNRPDPPEPPTVANALEGLSILDITVQEQSKITTNPIETGVEIADSKVRLPVMITIKGICDNKRGGSETTKDTRYGAPGTASEGFASGVSKIPFIGSGVNSVIGSVVDEIMGYEYEQEEQILTRAKYVYDRIHKMVMHQSEFGQPKTYTISSKGAVYSNMILESAEQLNDAEHLMVIPVTLKFKELIIAGTDTEDNVIPAEDQDGPLVMSGYLKKNSWLESLREGVSSVMDELAKPFS